MSSASDKYDLAETKLKAFTRSAVRTKVMLCLLEKELNAGELEKEMGLRATTILHSIKELSEEKLGHQEGQRIPTHKYRQNPGPDPRRTDWHHCDSRSTLGFLDDS
jgi:predicted transcriptional regulator